MKKTYINPTLTVANIQPTRILVGSPIGKGDEYNSETDLLLGRRSRFDDWDEDEFEFED